MSISRYYPGFHAKVAFSERSYIVDERDDGT